MQRRELITVLSGAAAWSVSAQAQQPAVPVIGLLSSASSHDYGPMIATFRKALGETGFIEGHNVRIEYRWADEQYDRLPALAAAREPTRSRSGRSNFSGLDSCSIGRKAR